MSPFNLHPACLLAGRSVGTLTRPFALRVTDAFVAGGIAVALRLSACGGSLRVTEAFVAGGVAVALRLRPDKIGTSLRVTIAHFAILAPPNPNRESS